jgi:hypothetical protein
LWLLQSSSRLIITAGTTWSLPAGSHFSGDGNTTCQLISCASAAGVCRPAADRIPVFVLNCNRRLPPAAAQFRQAARRGRRDQVRQQPAHLEREFWRLRLARHCVLRCGLHDWVLRHLCHVHSQVQQPHSWRHSHGRLWRLQVSHCWLVAAKPGLACFKRLNAILIESIMHSHQAACAVSLARSSSLGLQNTGKISIGPAATLNAVRFDAAVVRPACLAPVCVAHTSQRVAAPQSHQRALLLLSGRAARSGATTRKPSAAAACSCCRTRATAGSSGSRSPPVAFW